MQTRNYSLRLAPTTPTDNSVRFTASTPDLDRHGTRLLPLGCDSAAFERNPIVLWNHSKDGDPDDVLGRVVKIVKTAAAVEVVVEFDTHAKAQEVLRKVRAGFLRAVSVGFIPQQDRKNADGTIDVLKWELCELSIVPVPSNRQALKRDYSLRVTRVVRTCSKENTNSRGVPNTMNITEKLGLPADATPEQVAEKLIEFLSGGASTEDKMALILGMLTPSASSASSRAASLPPSHPPKPAPSAKAQTAAAHAQACATQCAASGGGVAVAGAALQNAAGGFLVAISAAESGLGTISDVQASYAAMSVQAVALDALQAPKEARRAAALSISSALQAQQRYLAGRPPLVTYIVPSSTGFFVHSASLPGLLF